MRIVVLTPTFLPAVGGAELVILQVYRRLATRHAVLVLTPYLSKKLVQSSGSQEYDPLINFAVEHYHDRFSLMYIRGHRVSGGLIPPFSLSAVSALQRATRDFKPDVINVHYVMPTGLAGFYAQRVLKCPVVITYNGRDVPGPHVPPLWKYWHRWIGRHCADMTFVSQYCRDVIYGPQSAAGHVVYNGVNAGGAVEPQHVKALRHQLQLRAEAQVLFALQRLDYVKRVDILIRSMPQILARRPHTYLVIGGQGSDRPRLEKLAAALGVAERVIFTGFIPEAILPVYLAMADLFVFHSTYETFGMVLAEAMYYGKAVVAVRNTAIPEVVDEGESGLLVPALDPPAFAAAVLCLLEDDPRRHAMGHHGREHARAVFSWDAIAEQYEAVLARAWKSSQGRSRSRPAGG